MKDFKIVNGKRVLLVTHLILKMISATYNIPNITPAYIDTNLGYLFIASYKYS